MKIFNKKRNLKVAALVFSLFTFHFSLFTCFAAHRYHTSLTRIDFNEKEKLIEITIQLFTHDLVPVLEKQTGKEIDLEKTPEIDKIILEYVGRNFVLKNNKGEEQKLNWVGKELEVDTAYVYVEIPATDTLEGATLQNTIFFESFVEQTNLVTARFGDKKSDLLFVAGDKFKEISAK
ncbi:MAG TPA: DUF6702 family protein [Pyrinomonadaceae bacterium]|jgi:hypothetical protein